MPVTEILKLARLGNLGDAKRSIPMRNDEGAARQLARLAPTRRAFATHLMQGGENSTSIGLPRDAAQRPPHQGDAEYLVAGCQAPRAQPNPGFLETSH